MMPFDPKSAFDPDRVKRVERLAALQRLRDQAQANDRRSMLNTINEMINSELRAMSRDHDHEAERQR